MTLKLTSLNAIFIILVNLTFTSTQFTDDNQRLVDDTNACFLKETCRECITARPECAWCTQDGFNLNRCDYPHNLKHNGCYDSHIYYPIAHFRKEVDNELSNKTSSESDAIQLKPQRIHLKLRPKSPYKLKVQFRQAVDYPVDLYYLMDLSKSMEDDKEKLASLGDTLASEMQRITSNFRLGFGSFVDKVVMPYVSMVPDKLKAPCHECEAPYGFKNHMPLDKDTTKFKYRVKMTNISGNLDAPEGGFDAIMQTVVCQKEINWRKNSRKLLVFSTDSGFHYAGDGKLGGIVKPNDGECHLENGLYTESTHQDYPSVSQINQKVKDYDVNLIFAVTSSQFDIYNQLTPLIQGSSAGLLMNDSSNVVVLVKSEYEKITSSVKLVDDASSDIEVTYFSACVNEERKKTPLCNGLRVGTTVEYDVTIEVLRCPANPAEWNQTFTIKPVGLSDQLVVSLEMICECDCEKEWVEERNSPKCSNGNGTYECGLCTCNKNRYGRKCECDANESDPETNELACYRGNDTKPCFGRGMCQCGVCHCFPKSPEERIYGKHCECDNFSCDRKDNKICSGPDHGVCDCGVCKCHEDWTGTACDCKRSVDDCIEKGSEKICSGRGTCKCGECKCHEAEGGGHYAGKFCELCPTCKTQCEKLRECVQCQIWGTGPLSPAECMNCSFTAFPVDKLEIEETDDPKRKETHCVFIDDDNCKAQFKYRIIDSDYLSTTHVEAQRTKDCPKPVNILAIVIFVIAGIVLIGLLCLIVWKIFTTINDRREYAKFEKERAMAKWDTGENPIYKQATTTFKNPTYGGKH